MNYELIKATINDKEILKNLMQFYFYDFSEYVEAHLEENGLFGAYKYLDEYWTEDSRFPYLVKLNGSYAGFALVRLVHSEEKTYYSIAEFFIMKKYRRTGLGKLVAHDIFNLYKGQWEVFQIEKNVPAQHFWRKVIDEYTNGAFTEKLEEGQVTQVFVS
jgi:predicted acetyltransferase